MADRYLRFVFLTGFAQVSVFSDLNQLQDISMVPAYATLCGITREKLVHTFVPEIKRLVQNECLSYEEILLRLEKLYDGYHFCEKITAGLFDPFSLLNVFSSCRFAYYWFQTGTPTYLVDLLKQSDYDLRLLTDGVEVTASAFSEYRADACNPPPMLYQSGYLTIKGYDKEVYLYNLQFPNDEV
ncbi:MAG: AAA family ATPase, partial [Bacteroides sp.]|nr:AAA family ATPase [Bacteroides sp.]